MKLLRLVSLVSSVVIGFSLSGCAGDTGTTPGTALNAYSHGQYWHANANDSVAKNAYSFAGFDVNFKEQEVTPGGDADNFLSKYLINSSMGYVTGGLKGFGIMSLSSLYSSSDAEYIQVNQYLVFVPNPKKLPYNDESLVREELSMFLSIQKQLRPHLDTTLKNRKQLWPHVKLIWQSSINGVPVICPLSLMLMFSLQIQCTAFRRFAPQQEPKFLS
uniref:hypothetical protein n=1 Tax=Enterobacter cloacae complex sp. TaxID=2027919 RepID=UPI0021003DE0|nr:hypothetical protein [Enterobacter cloacae complex sp.]